MKKITLLLFLMSFCFFNEASAQSLQAENFDGLTVGNVGTDITGATPGQGGLYTFTNPGANEDFVIVDSTGPLSNVLILDGPDTDTGSKFVWLNGLGASWATRTSGNDIIEIEYTFFTGAATTSDITTGMRLYDASFNTIAGFRFVPSTKVITGLAYFDPNDGVNPPGAYFFNLGDAITPEIVLDENAWYRVGFAFNKTTGQVIWRGLGFYVGVSGALAGTDPAEVDFTLLVNTGNAASTIAAFDDLTVRAVDVEALSAEDIQELSTKDITIFPNPVANVLRISITNNIEPTKVEVADMNGRVVKSILGKNFTNAIDVSELSSGLYILNIHSVDGKSSERFIKE